MYREISDITANTLAASYTNGTVTIQPSNHLCSGDYDVIIPAAAHSNNQWRSDIDIYNPGPGEAAVDIALLLWGAVNTNPSISSVAVPPGISVRIPDILGSILPASNAALGFRFCSGDAMVNSRFYNTASTCGGTYGMYVPALPPAGAVPSGKLGYFHHLSYSLANSSGYRTNIGFANATSAYTSVVVSFYGDNGALLGTLDKTLRPYEHFQWTRVHRYVTETEVTRGSATVQVITIGGLVHAYAMLIDNVSADPILIPVEVR